MRTSNPNNAWSVRLLGLLLLLGVSVVFAGGKTKFERLPFSDQSCPPGQKRSNRDKALFSCLPVSTKDVKDGIKWLSNPPRLASMEGCKNLTTVQDFSVCEDRFSMGPIVPSDSGVGVAEQPKCLIWSIMATQYCDDVGTLEFERYWAKRGCRVELYQYMMYIDGKLCKPKGKVDKVTTAAYWEEAPNLHVHRLIVWARRCYMCFYKEILQTLYGTENDRSGGINNGTVVVDAMKFQSRVKNRAGGLGVEMYHPLNMSSSSSVVSGDIHSDVYDGVQYAMLSDLFLYVPRFVPNIRQILVTFPFTKYSLIDNLGRETENGFNIYASAQLLSTFRAVDVRKSSLDPLNIESSNMRPLQLQSYLTDVDLDSRTDHFFSLSLVQLTVEELATEEGKSGVSKTSTTASQGQASADPRDLDSVSLSKPYFVLPDFCSLPKQRTIEVEKELRLWIEDMLQSRCVPERMWLPCERKRTYGPFLPCPQQLRDGLAFDYAVARGWCNFNHKASFIPPLDSVGQPQSHFTKKTQLRDTSSHGPRVRIAFFFTVYADDAYVRRLMRRLYSPDHYYMLHIDPTGSTKDFEESMHAMVRELTAGQAKSNIVIAKEVAIIYGAATASILLSRAMSWFDAYASGWDYFVPLTGSDYPLVSLQGMERILGHRQPHMPFLMAWSRETSASIQQLRTSPAVNSTGTKGAQSKLLQDWVLDGEVQSSIDATWKERGNKRFMGDNLMEVRAYSYAPPLTCNNAQGFYRLDARGFNGTQWLFPNDGVIRNGKGRAMTNHPGGGKRRARRERNRASAGRGLTELDLHNFDGEVRLWRKSDPGTSGAYDRETIRYIVGSEEGRKYFHFFKHMLLGSEEHYYVSLLYNWPRTKDFITDIASQGVWNTWELGEWSAGVGGFRTHTHYLQEKEIPILRGLSKRGVFFGRKFGSKNRDLLDAIDAFIDSEGSLAGRLWSGFLN